MHEDERRALPSVEQVLQTEPLRSAAQQGRRTLAVAAARQALDQCREAIVAGNGAAPGVDEIATRAASALQESERMSLGPVINATGVVIHTNLGRAPLPFEALEAIDSVASGYSNLEYEVGEGARGSRQVHVEPLIRELTGAQAAVVVNNNAAAVLLALAATAQDREVVISRGQLVEIGGSFRIPEILSASGARLVEVGTTNRTRIDDYANAIGPDTKVLMRVHASNFRTVGFTEETALAELATLARAHGLLLIDDLGSGALAPIGDEPSPRASIAAGADLVCFSADKLLGGPQAGIVAGTESAVGTLRAHPLARAVRIDKLSLAALEATLRLHRDPEGAARDIPVLQMLTASRDELEARAERVRAGIAAGAPQAEVRVAAGAGRAGGGALPLLELDGPVVEVVSTRSADEVHARLRGGDPPIVARVQDDAVLLDPRTITEVEIDFVVRGVIAALA